MRIYYKKKFWAGVGALLLGLALFLVGMKYGDRWEEALLKRFRRQ